MSYLGDFVAGASVLKKINTVDKTNGAPITLAGTPAVSVYKNGTTTESTSGVTLTVDHDGRTGMHHILVDTSADGTFYAAGNDFHIVITAGTVDGTSVVGTVVAEFSIENRNIKADLTKWLGTAVLTPDTAGTPKVHATIIGATSAGISNIADAVDASALATSKITSARATKLDNLDATVSSRMATFTLPTNFSALGINASGHVSRVTLVDDVTTKTGYSLSSTQAFNNTGSWTGNVIGNLTGSAGSIASAVTVGTNNDKTGYTATVSDKTGFKLASDGLDSIAIPSPSATPTTLPGQIGMVWRRLFKRVTKTSAQIRTYADDNTSVVSTQTISDDGTTQTQGPAT